MVQALTSLSVKQNSDLAYVLAIVPLCRMPARQAWYGRSDWCGIRASQMRRLEPKTTDRRGFKERWTF